MGLPHTLWGTIGFIVFAAWLIGEITVGTPVESNSNQQIIELSKNLQSSINTTASSDNIFTGILGVGETALASVQLMIAYLNVFLSNSGISGLPTEFFIFFAIIAITVIIALLKFIRSGFDI